MSAPAIDLERFATLGAEIEHGVPEAEVLAREGLAPSAWAEAQDEWLAKLAEETAERESDALNTRYRKAFEGRAVELEKQAKERPPAPEKAAQTPAPSGPEEPDLEAVEPEDDVRDEPPAQGVLPQPIGASQEVSPWAAGADGPPPEARPMGAGVDGPRPEPRTMAAGAAGAPPEARTMAFAASAARPSVLPFQAAASATPTSPGSVLPGPVSMRGGLPFQGVEGSAQAPAPVSMRGGLPFQPSPSPSVKSGPVSPVRLTLEQFAQLSAELAAAPGSQPAIAARYGFEPGGPALEHQAWSQRFALDRGLYERFRVLYQHYAAWLASPRR